MNPLADQLPTSPTIAATGHDTQPLVQQPGHQTQDPQEVQPPEPKRLRARANLPDGSHDQEGSESSHEGDPELEVDFF